MKHQATVDSYLSNEVTPWEWTQVPTARQPELASRWAAMLLSFAVLLLSLGWQAGSAGNIQNTLRAKTVRAELFRLRRPGGGKAAELILRLPETPHLEFFDRDGVGRLSAGLDVSYAPSVVFYGEIHDARTDLGLSPNTNNISLSMFNDDGVREILLGGDEGLAAIFVGRTDKTSVALHKLNHEAPVLRLSDEKANGLARFSAGENLETAVAMTGQDDTALTAWTFVKDGSPLFSIKDGASKLRLLILSTDIDGSVSVGFIDRDGVLRKVLRSD
jgi:hypothetical protein